MELVTIVKVLMFRRKKNILDSIITVEVWDIQEFTPAHTYAYSMVALEMAELKQTQQYKDLIKTYVKKGSINNE